MNDSTQGPWDRIAAGYDRTNTPTQMEIARVALERAGLRSGMQFLDVASGSGALSIPAARLGAKVTAVDLSAKMLELLRARAKDEGLSIATKAMDGHALDFPDGRFDMAGSQFGVMLFPEIPRGLREMARVTRAGGKVIMNVYGPPQKVEFLAFFVRAIQAVRPEFTGPPMDPVPLPFQLQDPERLRNELAAAGLKDVSVETITERTEFESGMALWDWLIYSNPIVQSVLGCLHISEPETEAIQRALDEQVRHRSAGNRHAVLTNPVHLASGIRR